MRIRVWPFGPWSKRASAPHLFKGDRGQQDPNSPCRHPKLGILAPDACYMHSRRRLLFCCCLESPTGILSLGRRCVGHLVPARFLLSGRQLPPLLPPARPRPNAVGSTASASSRLLCPCAPRFPSLPPPTVSTPFRRRPSASAAAVGLPGLWHGSVMPAMPPYFGPHAHLLNLLLLFALTCALLFI